LKNARKVIKRLKTNIGINNDNIVPKAIKKILNRDQIKLLTGEYKKMPRWSNETIHKALKYKFTCGRSGYEELSHDLPLPLLRILSRRLKALKFTSGILDEVFEFLRIKVLSFKKDLDKYCMLVLDEMSITPSNSFDTSTNTFVGCATLPNNYDNNTQITKSVLTDFAKRLLQIIVNNMATNLLQGLLLPINLADWQQKLNKVC